jgi:UDP-glucose 4-epimerase
MNYKDKKVAVSGHDGFLGRELTNKLVELGANVYSIVGDIRDPETFKALDYTYDYVFHFAAPSSQVLFKRQPDYAIETTIKGFLNVAKKCREEGIKLIYPSTGVLSQGGTNEYSRCKQLCEDYHRGSGLDALAVRIFATYGEQEYRKRDFASVPYLFARDIVNGKSPVVFGDGSQVRDFVYITDVINAITILAEECNDPVIDIGSGESVSFNTIIDSINNLVTEPVKPTYVNKPANYVQETSANVNRLHDFYIPQTNLETGIRAIIDALNRK